MMLKYYKCFMWPPFPCALRNRAVPEEGQQLGSVPTAPNRLLCLLFTGWSLYIFELGTWTLLSFFYQPQNSFFKDVYVELSGSPHRID